MSIDYTDMRSVEVQDVIEAEGVDFAIVIKEATFTTSTGCGASLDVEEFELSSYDNYDMASLYGDFIDPVVVEREDLDEVIAEPEYRELLKDKLDALALADALKRNQLLLEAEITMHLLSIENRDKIIEALERPWYRKPPWNWKIL